MINHYMKLINNVKYVNDFDYLNQKMLAKSYNINICI